MFLLAMDTSCDESCAAIVDTRKWRLLANVVHSHVDVMERYGGVVPEMASREHLKALPMAVDEALSQAGLGLRDLGWIGVTHRPGLIGALLVGVSYAKGLAYSLRIPYTAINHIEGHLYSPLLATLEGERVPEFPWLGLVVSGGHTELFRVAGPLSYEWLGGTLDDAAGEAFDKIGKLLGLPYPGGPRLDRWVRAEAEDADRRVFSFPRAKVDGFDFSFSGLKTAVSLQVEKSAPLSEKTRLQMAASAQEAIVDALVAKVDRAQRRFNAHAVVVTGGVAGNSRLREKLPRAYFPQLRFCTDNAAMIALVAALRARYGELAASPWSEAAFAVSDHFNS